MVNLKTCTRCKATKEQSEFWHDRTRPDGHRPECGVCANESRRKQYAVDPEKALENSRRWAAANPEAYKKSKRKSSRKWKANNPEKVQEGSRQHHIANRAKRLEQNRRWAIANPEKVLESGRKYNRNNKEKKLAAGRKRYATDPDFRARKAQYTRQWDKDNPEKKQARDHRHRALKQAVLYTLTDQQWETIKQSYSFACAYCGKSQFELEKVLEKDRIIPGVQGGGYTADNVVCACKSCNSKKSGRTPEQAGMLLLEKTVT